MSFFLEVIRSRQGATSALLLASALLDFLIGDPWHWPHPVQFMGKAIALYSRLALAKVKAPWFLKLLGIGLAVLLIGGTGLLSWLSLQLLRQRVPFIAWIVEVILLASCFAGRSLRQAAEDVLQPLGGDLDSGLDRDLGDDLDSDLPDAPAASIDTEPAGLSAARERLSMYVGRDTHTLSALEVRRAVLETASENAVDGVFAPLFFAILGGPFGLAAPLALAYKAASTLDSMVGYKEAPYTDLGWFSAKFEDVLTWVPCRISVLAIALLCGRPAHVLRLCRRDAPADPSPNAGWSECAYAAALGVRLGGVNSYRGQIKIKPFLGDEERPITNRAIAQAYQLTRRSFLLGLLLGIGYLWLLS